MGHSRLRNSRVSDVKCGPNQTEPRCIGHAYAESRALGEAIAKESLLRAIRRTVESRNLASIIRAHFGPSGGVDLELPPREIAGEPPSFE